MYVAITWPNFFVIQTVHVYKLYMYIGVKFKSVDLFYGKQIVFLFWR